MFTGIITSIGMIESAQQQGDLRLAIACDFAGGLRIGDSVAVNGACLTVVDTSPLPLREGLGGGVVREDSALAPPPTLPSPAGGEGSYFSVDVSAETIACTAPRWQAGSRANLERALKMGDSLDGHMVTGHVDGIAAIKEIIPSGSSHILSIDVPEALARFIAEKGSVTLDGVSLTVNKVEGSRFWVNIIPHTWLNTTLGERNTGDALNLEIDIIARYAARLLQK